MYNAIVIDDIKTGTVADLLIKDNVSGCHLSRQVMAASGISMKSRFSQIATERLKACNRWEIRDGHLYFGWTSHVDLTSNEIDVLRRAALAIFKTTKLLVNNIV